MTDYNCIGWDSKICSQFLIYGILQKIKPLGGSHERIEQTICRGSTTTKRRLAEALSRVCRRNLQLLCNLERGEARLVSRTCRWHTDIEHTRFPYKYTRALCARMAGAADSGRDCRS